MTAYVARTGARKKKEILAQREEELRHHIRNESGTGVVERAAERVRVAHLGVIKALLHETEPGKAEDHSELEQRLNLLGSREHWRSIPVEKIVERYRAEI